MSKKFSLTASPTFKKIIAIPIAGGRPFDIEFTFKHKTRDGFRDFVAGLAGRDDVPVILDIASGWDIDQPFDEANMEELVQNYLGSAKAVIEGYISELTSARLGN